MKYEDLLQSVARIIEDDVIIKENLTLTYSLTPIKHKQLDEELYIKLTGNINGFEHQDTFEIEVNNIIIKFVQKDLDN